MDVALLRRSRPSNLNSWPTEAQVPLIIRLIEAFAAIMSIDDGFLCENSATICPEDSCSYGECNRRWWYPKVMKYGKIGRRVLQVGVDLCHVRSRRRLNPNIRAKNPLWSDLVSYFYYYVAMKSVFVIYHQCMINYHKYKLGRFDQSVNDREHGSLEDLTQFRVQLVAEYE